MNRRNTFLIIIAVWLLLRILSFTLVQHDWSDIPIYQHYAENLIGGQTPYAEFDVEYPPIAIIIFAVPGFFAKYFGHYEFIYRLFMLLFDLGNILLLSGIAGFLYKGDHKKIFKICLFYLMLTSISFQFVLDRFDLSAAFMILLSIYLIIARKQWIWGYFLIWVATLTKLFPIILIPVLFAYQFLNYKDRNRAVLDFGYSVASFIVLFAAFFAWCGPWWNMVLAYHGQRGLQVESLYTSILLVGKLFGATSEVTRGHGAFELNTAGSSFFAGLALPLIGLLLIGVYFRFWSVLSHRKRAEHPDYLIKTVLACLLVFILFNKVLSPQFLLWIFPLAALAVSIAGFDKLTIGSWLSVAVFTATLFPLNYVSLLELHVLGIILLLLRNIALSITTGLVLKSIWK